MSMSPKPGVTRYAVSQNLTSAELDGDVVLLNFSDGHYYGLEAVAAEIWRYLQEPRTLDQLVEFVTSEFEVDPVRTRQDLINLLQDLEARKLVEQTA